MMIGKGKRTNAKFEECENEAQMKVPFHHFGLNESIPYPELNWNDLHDSEGPFITAENDERFPVAVQDAELIDV